MSGVSLNALQWSASWLMSLCTEASGGFGTLLKEALDIKLEDDRLRFNLDQIGLYECVIGLGGYSMHINGIDPTWIEDDKGWEYYPADLRFNWVKEHVNCPTLNPAWEQLDGKFVHECRSVKSVRYSEWACGEPTAMYHDRSNTLWLQYPLSGVHVLIKRKCDPALLIPSHAVYQWYEVFRTIVNWPKSETDLKVHVENEIVKIESSNGVHNTGVDWKRFTGLYG